MLSVKSVSQINVSGFRSVADKRSYTSYKKCKKDHCKQHLFCNQARCFICTELGCPFYLHDHSKQPLPAALLHLIGCDWLCPEPFTGLATATRPAGEVTPGASPAPLRARLHCQVQRGRGSPSIRATSFHTQSKRKGKKMLRRRQILSQRYTG